MAVFLGTNFISLIFQREMIVTKIQLTRCIDPILTIAATLSHRSPFFKGAPIQSFENLGKSDMVLLWKAYLFVLVLSRNFV